MKAAFIYGLRDPRTKAIRYIGKSCNPRYRLGQHRRDRPSNRPRNHRQSWIDALATVGVTPEIVILEACAADAWKDAERRWIAAAKVRGWDLVNGTDGGDAGPSVPRSGFEWARSQRALIMLRQTERWMRRNGFVEKADRVASLIALCREAIRDGQPRKVHDSRARALHRDPSSDGERHEGSGGG